MTTDSPYYFDFWTPDLKVTSKKLRSREIDRLQFAYLELSKLTYLPFMYGYGWTAILHSKIYAKVVFDLEKVMSKEIVTPHDIADIISTVKSLSSSYVNPDVSNSKYLQHKVDEYIKLSHAKTAQMRKIKNEILSDLTDFQKKKEDIQKDRELCDYLRVFMNEISQSYMVAELIVSDKFELKTANDSVIVQSAKSLLSLVPMVGPALHLIANVIDSAVKKAVQNAIKECAEKAVESFYDKEISELTEFVCISYLYSHKAEIKAKIQSEISFKQKLGDKYNPFSWICNDVKDLEGKVKSDLSAYQVHQYLVDQYQEPAEVMAYKDAWSVNEQIGSGKFLILPSEDSKDKYTYPLSKEQKIIKMFMIVAESNKASIEIPGEKPLDDNDQRGYLCGASCVIF